MSEKKLVKTPKGPLSAPVEADPVYLIVNPHGTMHVVTADHARERLRLPGWRLASADEKAAYKKANGNQRFDRPLAARFDPEPDIDEALPIDEAVEVE